MVFWYQDWMPASSLLPPAGERSLPVHIPPPGSCLDGIHLSLPLPFEGRACPAAVQDVLLGVDPAYALGPGARRLFFCFRERISVLNGLCFSPSARWSSTGRCWLTWPSMSQRLLNPWLLWPKGGERKDLLPPWGTGRSRKAYFPEWCSTTDRTLTHRPSAAGFVGRGVSCDGN